MFKRIIAAAAATLLLLSLCSCGVQPIKPEGLSIVCTAFPQYDFAKNILGSDKGLTLLLDGKEDFHSYEPNAADIVKIATADLFVYIGEDSEKWVKKTLAAAGNDKLNTFTLTEAVNLLDEETVEGMQAEDEHHHHHHDDEDEEQDEHVWLSLRNAAAITDKLCDAICAVDPQNTDKYRANADAYIARLNALDGEYTAAVSGAKRNTLIFADRFPFRYLVEDYGLKYYAAFPGCSAESEASFETMATLISKTEETGTPYVFIIDGSDGSIAEAVCKATGAGTLVLDSCQSVSADDIAAGESYLGAMTDNLIKLKEALN